VSAFVQPLPEPPADDVQELLALLTYARQHLSAAQHRSRRAEQLAGYSTPASMATRVMQRVRAFEVECWAGEVDQLVQRAHALGVEP
jgi:hypothetical protein